MTKGRLEAFSDGVLAIVITIMVLELRPPEGPTLDALFALWPKLLSYVLSFVYLGIYWNNHHHLLHASQDGQRRGPVGQPAPALLAVAGSAGHGLDRRELLRQRARGGLWRVASDAGDRLLSSSSAP